MWVSVMRRLRDILKVVGQLTLNNKLFLLFGKVVYRRMLVEELACGVEYDVIRCILVTFLGQQLLKMN